MMVALEEIIGTMYEVEKYHVAKIFTRFQNMPIQIVYCGGQHL